MAFASLGVSWLEVAESTIGGCRGVTPEQLYAGRSDRRPSEEIPLHLTAGLPCESTLLYALLFGPLSNLRRSVLDPGDVPFDLHAIDTEK